MALATRIFLAIWSLVNLTGMITTSIYFGVAVSNYRRKLETDLESKAATYEFMVAIFRLFNIGVLLFAGAFGLLGFMFWFRVLAGIALLSTSTFITIGGIQYVRLLGAARNGK
jgi:uncharacterized membrane protein